MDIPVEKLASMTYQEIAYEVMSRFLTDFTEDELKACIERAYDSKFDTKEIAPVKKADGAYYLELFHGATIAFKDMATFYSATSSYYFCKENKCKKWKL